MLGTILVGAVVVVLGAGGLWAVFKQDAPPRKPKEKRDGGRP